MAQVVHDAAVLGVADASSAETVNPPSATVAFDGVLARGDDFEADFADTIKR